jgi:hypothetical protein
MRSIYALTAMFAMLDASDMYGGKTAPKIPKSVKFDASKPESVVPKGCKQYFFNDKGEFSTEKMLKSEVIFKCIASNDKNAVKKFRAFADANGILY